MNVTYNIRGKDVKISLGMPFVIVLYILGCGLGWWDFSYWKGFLAVLLDMIF